MTVYIPPIPLSNLLPNPPGDAPALRGGKSEAKLVAEIKRKKPLLTEAYMIFDKHGYNGHDSEAQAIYLKYNLKRYIKRNDKPWRSKKRSKTGTRKR